MDKTSVVYLTMTNHSKKLAEAIAEALQVKAQNIKEEPDLEPTGLLFIVGGIYAGKSLPEMRRFVSELDPENIKKAALVTSSAKGGERQDEVRKILEEKGIEIVDEYRCIGNFLFVRLGHPNRTEIGLAADFAKKLAAQEE